jgi:type I restriction enzyme S subunit
VRTVALGEIVTDARPGFASGEDTTEGIVQVRMNNVTTEGTFDWSKLRRVPEPKKLNDLIVKSNDILLNATNSPDLVGKNAVFRGYSEPVTFSNHFIRIRLDERIADSGLVSRWLTDQWRRGKFKSMCRQWVNQASLNKDQLLSLDVPLLPLDEQRRIAAILDQADDLRRMRREALAMLENLVASILRLLPANRLVRLGELATIATGSTPSRQETGLHGGQIPWVKTTEVALGGTIVATEECVTPAGAASARLKLFPVNSIVVAMYGQGTTRGKVAKLGKAATVNQACAVIMPNKEFEPDFLLARLVASYERLRDLGRGGNQPNLNLDLVRSFEISIPSLDVQRAFAARVAEIDQLKAHHRAQLAKLDALFASLQHRAFRGEL